MYLMFGRRKLPRKVLRWSANRVHGEHWAEDLIESFGLAPSAPSAVRLHQDGGESAAALFATMSSAARRLDICTYILGNDAFGRERHAAHDRTCAARRAGETADRRRRRHPIAARVLRAIESAGIETAIFSPLFARKTQGPRNLRNHRKMVDRRRRAALGAAAETSPRNISAGLHGAKPWRDLSFDLQGPVAAAAAAQFEADGSPRAAQPAGPLARAAMIGLRAPDPGRPRPVFAERPGPGRRHGACAADRCLLSCPRAHARGDALFRPRRRLETAMRLAARRGVKIDLVHPRRVESSSGGFRAQSRAARAQQCRRQHSLGAVHESRQGGGIRRIAGALRSVNLDSRSLLLNYECAVVFYGAAKSTGWRIGSSA